MSIYIAGQHACPGRTLAKRIQLISAAMLLQHFDIQLPPEQDVCFGNERFGFGVSKPLQPIPFRIRRV